MRALVLIVIFIGWWVLATFFFTRMQKYNWNILIALDQLANAIFLGYPDETFSCRTYRKAKAGQLPWKVLRWAIDRIFFWQKAHCQEAYESELLRKHSPREFN